jgi:hypothetical protein
VSAVTVVVEDTALDIDVIKEFEVEVEVGCSEDLISAGDATTDITKTPAAAVVVVIVVIGATSWGCPHRSSSPITTSVERTESAATAVVIDMRSLPSKSSSELRCRLSEEAAATTISMIAPVSCSTAGT